MGEPYFRITTAKSELDEILYDTTSMGSRLASEGNALKAKGLQSGVPAISSIKSTHRFPFRTVFTPVINSANQFVTQDNATNRRFNIDYSGEFMGRMYQAYDFSAGTVAPVDGTNTVLWAYCPNFIAAFTNEKKFKVSTDTLYEFPGHMYFIWYSLIVPMARRPALSRCLRECCFEFKWIHGIASKDLTNQSNRTTAGNVLALQHPYSPLQSYEVTHGAFTAYVPLDIFTLSNVENAYPLVGVYSLNRSLEYSDKAVTACINVWADDGTWANGGLVDPTATNPTTGVFTWASTPAVTNTRLVVEYFVVHKDLQHMLALNAHGYLIRQYFDDTETLTDKTSREISVTKIVETLYILCRHEYSVTHTAVNAGVNQITINQGGGTANFDRFYEIDPFYLPVDEKPINRVTLSARGQTFYKELDWDELSAVNPYLFSTENNGTTCNHSIGVFTFAHHYCKLMHTGSYNSGFGPNLKLSWRSHAFSHTDPGRLDSVLQGLNMVLAYRGALSIRYT